jgi:hypothetical protein
MLVMRSPTLCLPPIPRRLVFACMYSKRHAIRLVTWNFRRFFSVSVSNEVLKGGRWDKVFQPFLSTNLNGSRKGVGNVDPGRPQHRYQGRWGEDPQMY